MAAEGPRFLLSLLVACAVASCGPAMTFVQQRYDGPPLPRKSIAILRVVGGEGPTIERVDERDIPAAAVLEPGTRLHVEVLPGPHEVDVTWVDPRTGLQRDLSGRFVADAGRVYRVVLEVDHVAPPEPSLELAAKVVVYEVDDDSNAKLRVAPTDRPASPAPRPPEVTTPAVP